MCAAAHHGRREPLLHHFARAGLDQRLTLEQVRAMGLLVEIGPHAIGFLLREQARIGMGVRRA